MEKMQPLQPRQEEAEPGNEAESDESVDESEELMPMPFGVLGIAFLCALTQYAVFLGLTMIILMIIHYFGQR